MNDGLPLLLVVFVGLLFAYSVGFRRGKIDRAERTTEFQIVARDLITLLPKKEPLMPRPFKPCARPFFDLTALRYGRCDRPANHPLGACRGPLSSPGTTEARELRAEHVKIGQQEGWRA